MNASIFQFLFGLYHRSAASMFSVMFPFLDEFRRTRQTLWGECTDANPKTVAKRYTIEKKLVPLQYES